MEIRILFEPDMFNIPHFLDCPGSDLLSKDMITIHKKMSKTLVFGLFTNTKLGLERIWRYGLASQYKKNFLPFITSFNLHLEAILVGVQIAREVNLE